MTQVEIGDEARATEYDRHDGTREIAPDIAYFRTIMANVVLVGRPGAGDRNWVLVDAGVPGTKGVIKKAAAARFGEQARPAAIILTHGHFDHVGGLEDLAEEWGAPVYAHPLEHPYLTGQAAYPAGDPSVGGGLMASLSGLYPTKPIDVSSGLKSLPEDGSVPFMPGWKWLHTPGHSPGHVSFWRVSDRALIVGDAFITTKAESAYAVAMQTTEIHGPPQYFTIDWSASRASVEILHSLAPDLVVTGHGLAMQGGEMRAALHTLARDFDRLAVPEEGKYVADPARAEDGSAYLPPA
jgi:glyoxylase-like metal-dependent hydrolase (beta-lactamase superfamily II)